MAIFGETLRALAPLFLLMVLGAVLRRVNLLRPEHVPILNNLVVNVTMPALVVRSLASAPTFTRSTLWLPVAVFAGQVVTMAAVLAFARVSRMSNPRTGALLMTGPYGNTGFLGYPITLALYPHQFTAAVLIDQIAMTIPMFVGAPWLGTAFGVSKNEAGPENRRTATARGLQFFRSPIFAALAIGLVLRFAPIPPSILRLSNVGSACRIAQQCLTYLGQGTVPLILLGLGASLRPTEIMSAPAALATAIIAKLLLMPFVAWQVLQIFHVTGEFLAEGVMMAGMPSAVMASVLSRHHNMDGDFAVTVVFVTTVLSLISLPCWISLVR